LARSGKTVMEFADFISGDDAPIVVGGQGVDLWSEITLKSSPNASEELSPFLPFTSKDCDVLGDRQLLQKLGKKTKLCVKQYSFGQATCCIGFLYDPDDPDKEPIIEVLNRVRGLSSDELSHPIELLLDGKKVRTLNPLQLLKAKLANLVELDQATRQDVRHVKMLIPCVREYLTMLHTGLLNGKVEIKNLKIALRHCQEIINSMNGKKVAAEHGIDLEKCIPVQTLKDSPHEAIQNFCKWQLKMQDNRK